MFYDSQGQGGGRNIKINPVLLSWKQTASGTKGFCHPLKYGQRKQRGWQSVLCLHGIPFREILFENFFFPLAKMCIRLANIYPPKRYSSGLVKNQEQHLAFPAQPKLSVEL